MFWNIDKNIDMPDASKKVGAPAKYPFSKMSVGESVFFDGETSSSNCTVAAYNLGRKKGWKFCARAENGGVRIWRTA